MAQKDASQPDTWAGNQFTMLELEIDKEIDSLFIPAGQRASANAAVAVAAQESHAIVGMEAESSEPGINKDSGMLELEIDKEIDSLFVPAGRRADANAPADAVSAQASHSSAGMEAESSEPGINKDSGMLELEIDKGIDSIFVPADRRMDANAPAAAFSAQASHSSAGMEAESSEPSPDVEAAKPVTDKPFVLVRESDAFSGLPGVSELIEQFNAAYLSLDWEFSRENLQKFIDALERLKPMASRSADAKSVLRIMEVILKRLFERPRAINTRLVQLIRDSQGLLAHMLLLDGESGPHEKQRLKELVEKFQDLRQKALAVKAASAGSETRDISSGGQLGTSTDTPPQVAVDPSPSASITEKEDISAASSPEPVEKSEAVERSFGHADACLIVLGGKWLALPASRVVKATHSGQKTGRKVLKRGYATLSDFKPLFRGMMSGVTGQWAELGPEELGSYRFEPMGFDFAGGDVADGPIAVLASDGQAHRVIFCDMVLFISNAEISDGSRVMAPFFDLHDLPASVGIRGKD